MTKLHLLYWVFDYLSAHRPDVLEELRTGLPDRPWGENATSTIRKSFEERLDAYRQTKLQRAAVGLMGGAIIAASLLCATPAQAQGYSRGWFIVAGSYPRQYQGEALANASRVKAAASRCGIALQGWASDEFVGLPPGRSVQVVGGFRTKARAQHALALLRPCVPDAFIAPLINATLEDE